MVESAKLGEKVIELRPLTLRQLRDNWKLLSEPGQELPELLTMAATIVGLSCGLPADAVMDCLGADGAPQLFELADRVRKLSNMGTKGGGPPGEAASP